MEGLFVVFLCVVMFLSAIWLIDMYMSKCQHDWKEERVFDRYYNDKMVGYTVVYRCTRCKKVKLSEVVF